MLVLTLFAAVAHASAIIPREFTLLSTIQNGSSSSSDQSYTTPSSSPSTSITSPSFTSPTTTPAIVTSYSSITAVPSGPITVTDIEMDGHTLIAIYSAGRTCSPSVSCKIPRGDYPKSSSNYMNPYQVYTGDPQFTFTNGLGLTTATTYDEAFCASVWDNDFAAWLSTASVIAATYTMVPFSTTIANFSITDVTEVTVLYSATSTIVVSDSSSTYTSLLSGGGVLTQTSVTTVSEYATVMSPTLVISTSAYYVQNYTWVGPTGMCCSSCLLHGADVQLMNWPTPAPSPPVSTLVNTANNFTFVSPSIYIAFKSLWATDSCGSIGSLVPQTTLAFNQDELSTYLPMTSNGEPFLAPNMAYETVDFTKATWGLNPSCTMETSSYYTVSLSPGLNFLGPVPQFSDAAEASSFLETAVQYSIVSIYPDTLGFITSTSISTWASFDPAQDSILSFTYSYNQCSPYISIPTQVYSLEPVWTNCIPAIQALFDPPYTLTAGADLSAPSTTAVNVAQQIASTTTSAAAGQGPTQSVTATQAPTTAPVPTSTQAAQVVNDPSSSIQTQSQSQPQPTSTAAPLILIPVTYSVASTSVTDPATTNTQPLAVTSSLTTSPSAYLISINPTQTQTLIPGGAAVTVGSTTLSLPASGSSIVINGQTSAISAFVPASTMTTVAELILPNSQTLTAGGAAATVSGTILSLQSGGSSIIAIPVGGGTTNTLAASVLGGTMTVGTVPVTGTGTGSTSGTGLAGLIASIGGFGAGGQSSSSSTKASGSSSATGTGKAPFNGTIFLGGGERLVVKSWVWVWGTVAGLLIRGMGLL